MPAPSTGCRTWLSSPPRCGPAGAAGGGRQGAHYLRWDAACEAGLVALTRQLAQSMARHRVPVRRLERVAGAAGEPPALVVLTGSACEADILGLRAEMARCPEAAGSAWLRVETLD
jgi:homoserine dehydrogenase